MMKISIVIAYYNRKNLLENTLKSISLSSFKNYEIIVVDDGSDEKHRIEYLCDEFYNLKIIRLERKNRWYVNPCVPYNIGFKQTTGDVVIIQNPECFHGTDILSYVCENLNENDYFSFSTYVLNEQQTNILNQLNVENIINEIKKIVQPYNMSVYHKIGKPGWYNHTIYRPAAYHFCSAIFKKKLNELNGFDERYAHGVAYDDDEFILRIKRNNMNIKIIDELTVFHQYHENVSYNYLNINDLMKKNRDLLFNVTKKENTIYVNNI